MHTCQGKTRSARPAGRPRVREGCAFSTPIPDRAKISAKSEDAGTAGRLLDLQIPDNLTAADLRNLTVQAIRLLLSGDLHAREASALVQLCNSLHRVIPTADLEARVAMLEEQVAQEESGASPEPVSDAFPTEAPEPTTSALLGAEQPNSCVESSTSVDGP